VTPQHSDEHNTLNEIPLHRDELLQQRALDLRELVWVFAFQVSLG
jgi:hypothetical protein